MRCAGNPAALKAAVFAGADAVYMGGSLFSARASAVNFSREEMREAVLFARERNVRVYVTVNTLLKDDELPEALDFCKFLCSVPVDGILIQDMGLFNILREACPEMPLHASTQMSLHTPGGAALLKELGASRVVLAREMSLKEIEEVSKKTDVELEAFVHGALCMSLSGQCYFSAMLGGRSGNRGRCAQTCRLPFAAPGGTGHDLSLKDMSFIDHIETLHNAGVCSAKIEGRMKTALYVATVARTYRIAIDDYLESPEKYQSKMEWYKSEIRKCTHREYITGFYFHKPGTESQVYGSNTYVKPYTYLGTVGAVRGDGLVHLEQKNKFSVGETIEIMKPDGSNVEAKVLRILNEDGEEQESAPHSKQVLHVELSETPAQYDLLRRQEEDKEVNS